MFRRSLLIICIFAAAISFGCSDEDCSNCNEGAIKPIDPADPIISQWQAASGLENIAGACDRPTPFQGAFVLPNLMQLTDNLDGTYELELPNGCAAPFEETETGIALVSTTTCNDVFYQVGPATMTITAGSAVVRGEDDDEADFTLDYTITQDLTSVGGPEDSVCELSLLFTQITEDDGDNPLETVATFGTGDFIESVERDANNTWVMKVTYVDTGDGDGVDGVYKIPEGGNPELISNYGPGFGGNIVFDEDDRLFGTYSDAENTDPDTLKRQVVEIDTETGDRTVIADLPADSSPNGITLDTLGNIYVADSVGYRIFRIPAGGGTADVEVWAEGGSLIPMSPSAPGPNGLKIFDQHLYVSVSGSLMLIRIPITGDGSAGTSQQVSMGVIGDDFSLDVDGNTWMTTHPMNGVVLMRPDGTVRLIHDYLDEVWGPTSAVFGVAPGDTTTLYVCNDGNAYAATVFAQAPWFQQSSELFPATVQRVDVGVEGAPVPGEVILDVDTDEDGLVDSLDNCPLIPNGPDLGTCFSGDSGAGATCNNDGECGVDEQCQMDQEDSDEDGIGDVCDDCPFDADDDADEDGVCGDEDNCPEIPNGPELGTCFSGASGVGATCNSDGDCGGAEQCQMDQENSDGDDFGDVCDPCPEDPLNECGTGGPTIIPADVLDPAGCDTYIGAHPLYPDETDPAYDVVYEFCDDGTVSKQWDPDPIAGTPGPTDGDGTWSVNPSTNELTIVTAGKIMGTVDMETTEIYDVGFTYDGGADLDLNSAARVPAGDGSTVVGNYERHSSTVIVMSGFIDANVVTTSDTTTTVTEGAWESEMVVDIACTGSPLVCGGFTPGPTTTETSGTFEMPGELFDLDGMYIFQTEDKLVFERQ